MKIDSFNIGYGPKLVSFNDSTGTEFALRALPLGGYVAFPSNVVLDPETGDISSELDDPDLIQNRPPLQRAAVRVNSYCVSNLWPNPNSDPNTALNPNPNPNPLSHIH